jgi:hypothetical protein
LSNYDALLKYASQGNAISQQQLQTLQSWKSDPQKWSENFVASDLNA